MYPHLAEYLWLFRFRGWGKCLWRCRWTAAASLHPFGLVYQNTNCSRGGWEKNGNVLKITCNIWLNHHYSRYCFGKSREMKPDMDPPRCVGEYTHPDTHPTHPHRVREMEFYSLLSLDRVHRSNIIAGNVTSSTCGERTSLPPVSLAGDRRTQRD